LKAHSNFQTVSLGTSVNRGPVEQRLLDAALTGRAIAAGLLTFPFRAPFGSRRGGGGYGLLEHGARRLFSLGGDGEHLGPAHAQPATGGHYLPPSHRLLPPRGGEEVDLVLAVSTSRPSGARLSAA
jgi:hypothetical protein